MKLLKEISFQKERIFTHNYNSCGEQMWQKLNFGFQK